MCFNFRLLSFLMAMLANQHSGSFSHSQSVSVSLAGVSLGVAAINLRGKHGRQLDRINGWAKYNTSVVDKVRKTRLSLSSGENTNSTAAKECAYMVSTVGGICAQPELLTEDECRTASKQQCAVDEANSAIAGAPSSYRQDITIGNDLKIVTIGLPVHMRAKCFIIPWNGAFMFNNAADAYTETLGPISNQWAVCRRSTMAV